MDAGFRPGGLALAPRRGWLLTTDRATDTVRVHELAGGKCVATISVGREPASLAVTPDEKLGVVGNRLPAGDASNPRASASVSLIDLAALGTRTDIILPPNGANVQGVAIAPDGRWAYVVHTVGRAPLPTDQIELGWITGNVAIIDASSSVLTGEIALGQQPDWDQERCGEMIFHDATRCYQHWLSCATCHPDGRADGLNWDLLNDGVGNPKNTKSLLFAHLTPPAMSEGVRADAETAVAAGFRSILFQPASPEEIRAVEAYLQSLGPEPGPVRANARLIIRVKRGQALFESARARCRSCHPRPLFTDCLSHDVGTALDTDRTRFFDTPSLVELWRTSPYLHHGKAVTLRALLTDFNPHDRHGRTSDMSAQELDDLICYLNSR